MIFYRSDFLEINWEVRPLPECNGGKTGFCETNPFKS